MRGMGVGGGRGGEGQFVQILDENGHGGLDNTFLNETLGLGTQVTERNNISNIRGVYIYINC